MLIRETKTFAFPASTTPDEVLAEIERNYSSRNPSIGKIQSCFLRNGPMVYKLALMQQIVDQEGKHHHNVLILESYKKLKGGWEHQDTKKITLDDKEIDEITLLEKFITAYKDYTQQEKKTFGVIASNEYDKFEKVVSSEIGNAIESVLEDADNYQKIVQQGGLNLVKDVIEWVFTTENSNAIVEKLRDLDLESLQEITTVAGITQINKVLEIWKSNLTNCEEEFWQKTLSNFSWIISQLFSTPVILYNEKAYVGGKFVDNKGGNLLDFLYQHNLTSNVSLIEIKTPCTELVGKKYRQTFSMSEEFSGAINQTLNYKHQIQKHYISLKAESKEAFEVINPKTLLIVGHITNELSNDNDKLEAFEIYRQNLKDVSVITFDELFNKIEILKSILEKGH
jgi:Domain of unknown function (DUF4263)